MSKTQSDEMTAESANDVDAEMDEGTESDEAGVPGEAVESGTGAKKPKRQSGIKDQPEVTVNPASFANLRPQQNGRKEKASLEMLLDIGLQVTVELGRTKMNIRDVLAVGPGTVVELNRVAGEPVDILINGKAVAKGEVVVIGDMFGVRVTDILPPAQRVQSML